MKTHLENMQKMATTCLKYVMNQYFLFSSKFLNVEQN